MPAPISVWGIDSCLGVALVAGVAFAARIRGLLPFGRAVAAES